MLLHLQEAPATAVFPYIMRSLLVTHMILCYDTPCCCFPGGKCSGAAADEGGHVGC